MYKRSGVWVAVAMWMAAGAWVGGVSPVQAQEREADIEATGGEEDDLPQSHHQRVQPNFENSTVTDRHSGGYLLDGTDRRRPHQIAFTFGVPCWFHDTFPLSFSLRWHGPILHNGFIPAINDWFGIELGMDFTLWATPKYGSYLDGNLTQLTIPLEIFWAIRFTPKVAAYLKLGVGFGFQYWLWDDSHYQQNYAVYLKFKAHPIAQLGLMWNFSRKVSLRLESGYPHIVNIGFGFSI